MEVIVIISMIIFLTWAAFGLLFAAIRADKPSPPPLTPKRVILAGPFYWVVACIVFPIAWLRDQIVGTDKEDKAVKKPVKTVRKPVKVRKASGKGGVEL